MSKPSIYFYLVLVAAGFLASVCLTPVVRKIAVATGRIAVPKDTRWHKKETALLGGIAIFVSTVGVWIAAAGYSGWEGVGSHISR